MSDQNKTDTSAEKPGLTPTLEKQAQQTAVQGKAGSIDQATRQALLDKQDKAMNNPPKTEPVEEVEVEDEDAQSVGTTSDLGESLDQMVDEMSEDESDFGIDLNTTDMALLVGGAFETVKPEFRLQFIIPLMSSNTSAEDLVVLDDENQEWTFNNPLSAGKKDRPTGVLHSSLQTLLERMAELNGSNFLIAGNSLTRNIAIEMLSANFSETNGFDLPELASEELFQELVDFIPSLGTSPSQDEGGVLVSLLIPMPIVASGTVTIEKFLNFLENLTSKHGVPSEVMFVADPLEFMFDETQLSSVRALTELGFHIHTLEQVVEMVEESNFDIEIDIDVDSDEEDYSEDDDDFDDEEVDEEEDDDEDSDDVDSDDEDEVIEDEDENEDEELESDLQMTLPKTMSGLEQTLFANGIQSLGTFLITKKL